MGQNGSLASSRAAKPALVALSQSHGPLGWVSESSTCLPASLHMVRLADPTLHTRLHFPKFPVAERSPDQPARKASTALAEMSS